MKRIRIGGSVVATTFLAAFLSATAAPDSSSGSVHTGQLTGSFRINTNMTAKAFLASSTGLMGDFNFSKEVTDQNSSVFVVNVAASGSNVTEVATYAVEREKVSAGATLHNADSVTVLVVSSEKEIIDLAAASLASVPSPKAFVADFKSAVKMWKKVGAAPKGAASPYFLVRSFPAGESRAPSTVSLQIGDVPAKLSLANKELTWARLLVGAGASKYKLKDVKLADGELQVTPSNASELKDDFIVGLNLHWPRYDDEFFADKHHPFQKGGGWWSGFHQRLGLYGGVDFSKDPLSNLSAGATLSITKSTQLMIGALWSQQPSDQTVAVPGATKLEDARAALDKEYQDPVFFIGVSMYPGDWLNHFTAGN